MNDNQVIARVPQGLRPERPQFTDGTDIPDALWSTITLCWKREASHRPTAQALVEATRSLATLRELTPPYFDTKECSDTASTDDVIGERVVDPTVFSWAGDRLDWQEYLHGRMVARSEEIQHWSRSHPWQNDPLL